MSIFDCVIYPDFTQQFLLDFNLVSQFPVFFTHIALATENGTDSNRQQNPAVEFHKY